MHVYALVGESFDTKLGSYALLCYSPACYIMMYVCALVGESFDTQLGS